MKKHIFLSFAMVVLSASMSYAQERSDSIRIHSRNAELTLKRNQLKQRIADEDKNRNSQLVGVSPEQMEIINLRQDSLCLELRSQLVAVELELAELDKLQSAGSVPGTSPVQGVQQFIQSLKPTRPQKEPEGKEQK